MRGSNNGGVDSIDCKGCLEKTDAYFDGELDAESRCAVNGHIAACPACADAYAAYSRVIAGLRATPQADVPTGFRAAWSGAVRLEYARRRRVRAGVRIASAAVALFIVVGASLLFALQGTPQEQALVADADDMVGNMASQAITSQKEAYSGATFTAQARTLANTAQPVADAAVYEAKVVVQDVAEAENALVTLAALNRMPMERVSEAAYRVQVNPATRPLLESYFARYGMRENALYEVSVMTIRITKE
jgi:anti-sigma factor RsiW